MLQRPDKIMRIVPNVNIASKKLQIAVRDS